MAVPLFAALAVASFFFALAESALLSLGRWRARHLAERHPARGALVLRLVDQWQELLGTIVLGNAVANSLLVAVGLVLTLHGDLPLWVTGPALLLLVLLLCEVAPKSLGVRDPEAWALRVAPAMRGLLWITLPVRRVAQTVVDTILRAGVPRSIQPVTGFSEEEYAELIDLAHQQGTLQSSEREILLRILTLDQQTAGDVMRPRAQMMMLPDDLPLPEMIAAARASAYRRIPLYDETPDTVVGILNTRTLLLHPGGDAWEAIEFPSFVPESMNLLRLFESLQRQRRGVAVVLDEFGGVAGLVTLEDILESMVGEIRGEGEAPEFVLERLGPGRWRASGTLPLDEFRPEHPALGEVEEVDTLGGLVVRLAEVVPAVGEKFLFRGLRLTVEEADERRVRGLLVERVKGGGA